MWTKPPYPENADYMYGMTQYALQFNHLPDSLKPYLPPTDCRFRPDQRALENGDFKLAAAEKNRLEEKQRAVRKFNEKHGITPKPFYFDEYENPDDPGVTYYRYNGKYFEQDRKELNWARLPDLYSDKLPPPVEEFCKQS